MRVSSGNGRGVVAGRASRAPELPRHCVRTAEQQEGQQRRQSGPGPKISTPRASTRSANPSDGASSPAGEILHHRIQHEEVDEQRDPQPGAAVAEEAARALRIERRRREVARDAEEQRHEVRLIDGGEPGEQSGARLPWAAGLQVPAPAGAEGDRQCGITRTVKNVRRLSRSARRPARCASIRLRAGAYHGRRGGPNRSAARIGRAALRGVRSLSSGVNRGRAAGSRRCCRRRRR